MEKQNLFNYFNSFEPIYSEINIQSRINHPNIIKLLFAKESKTSFDLVMEYAPKGTLFDCIVKSGGFSENVAYNYFIQIVLAIKFLHDNQIIHRDIKPENILLFGEGTVKLCDFGWAIQTYEKLPPDSFFGTAEYMSPEIINHKCYGKCLDIWTLGILLYELIHSFSPFRPQKAKFTEDEIIDNIRKHDLKFYRSVTEECKKLICGLLEYDENKRFTVEDIINSDFIKIHEKIEGKNIIFNRDRLKNDNIAINLYEDINNDGIFNNIEHSLMKNVDEIGNANKSICQTNRENKDNFIFFSNKFLNINNSFNSNIKKLRHELQLVNNENRLIMDEKNTSKSLNGKIIILDKENKKEDNSEKNRQKKRLLPNNLVVKFNPQNFITSSSFFRNVSSPIEKTISHAKTVNFAKDKISQRSNYEEIKKDEPLDRIANFSKTYSSKSQKAKFIFNDKKNEKKPKDNIRKKSKKLVMKEIQKREQEPKDSKKNTKPIATFFSNKNISNIQSTEKNIQKYLSAKNVMFNNKPFTFDKKLKKKSKDFSHEKIEPKTNKVINEILNSLQNY